MVPLQMELGGKDVCIVCADADLELAAKSIVKGGFSYSGQRCTAVKLVLVVKEVSGAASRATREGLGAHTLCARMACAYICWACVVCMPWRVVHLYSHSTARYRAMAVHIMTPIFVYQILKQASNSIFLPMSKLLSAREEIVEVLHPSSCCNDFEHLNSPHRYR
jgi:hypothetical protein